MKSRTDKTLLAVFLLSLAAYIFLLLTNLGIVDLDLGWDAVRPWLSLTFHAVPAFCLQLLLCRRPRRWIAALPGLAVIGTALWSACGAFTAIGWDRLDWLLLLLLCTAPAAGIAPAWVVYGIDRLRNRGNIHG